MPEPSAAAKREPALPPAAGRPALTATAGWPALAAAAALAVSFLLAPEALPGLDSCYFRKITGFACPGCGLSHSFCAISHGRFLDAWAYNPFGIIFYSLAAALVLRPVAARFLPRHGRPEWLVRGALPLTILLVVAMYAFAIARTLSALKESGITQ